MQKKIRQKIQHKKGFTLIEILFAVSIFVLIMGALTYFSRNLWVYSSYVSTGLNDSNNGRIALKRMVYEIRGASNAANGSYVIALASPTAFTFYSDIDNDGLVEKVRYFLSGNLLQKGVTKPSGNPQAYTLPETVTTVISHVTSASIFDYYDKNYDGTTAPLTVPVSIPAIRLVKISFNIDTDPNRAPVTSTFTTQVSIRNLKDNL